MAAPPMDPQYEQRLRDEVIYLHSLWHQGPPRAPASFSTAAVPVPVTASRHRLQPRKEAQFKKKKKRPKRGKKSTNKPNNAVPESKSSSGAEWPVTSPPPQPSTTGWPSLVEKPHPKPLSLFPEEQSKLAAKHAHQRALKVVHEFFRSNNNDDSDSIDSSSDEDDDLMEEDDGREEYSFFFKVFREDVELREYYEKNFAKGEFNCLVCGAVGGKNTGKKFKGCLALVQHSITIAKTKKRRAHRAFGQAVCRVLGWDIDQLQSVVSLLHNNSGETQRNVNSESKDRSETCVNNVDSVEGNNGEAVPESGSIGAGILPSRDEGDMNPLMCPDDDKNLENLGMVHSQKVEEPAVEVLTSVSVDKNSENLGMVHSHKVEEPAAEVLTSVSVDKNSENLGMVHSHKVEEPAAQTSTSVRVENNMENLCMVHPGKVEEPATEVLTSVSVDENLENLVMAHLHPHITMDPTAEVLTSNSLTCPVTDNNSENLDMVHLCNVDEPATEGLTSVPLSEDNSIGDEVQNLQMDSAVLNVVNEDNVMAN